MADGASSAARPRGLGPSDLLTADELALYVHRRRADAVAWARRHGLALKCGDGVELFCVGEVLQAMRDELRRGKRAHVEPLAPIAEPLVLAEVPAYRGGPRRPRA